MWEPVVGGRVLVSVRRMKDGNRAQGRARGAAHNSGGGRQRHEKAGEPVGPPACLLSASPKTAPRLTSFRCE